MQADIYLLSVQECRTFHHLVKEEVASSVLEITESSEHKDTAVVCRMLPPVNWAGLERMLNVPDEKFCSVILNFRVSRAS